MVFNAAGFRLAGAFRLGENDVIEIVVHVQHLIGGVARRSVLLSALVARRTTLVVPWDFMAMLSRPFCHLSVPPVVNKCFHYVRRTNGGPRPCTILRI
ncbi:MAG: hypothetical protein E2O98_04405 [Acidobacteria bacterium]|nr:MAG: hypothetical protein E2O98_04405 [Acidobacteriota bacterium]